LAIEHLSRADIDEVKKIELARTYEIEDWLYPSYKALALRNTSLSYEEMSRLGFEFAAKMATIREKLVRGKLSNEDADTEKTVADAIWEVFGVKESAANVESNFSESTQIDGQQPSGSRPVSLTEKIASFFRPQENASRLTFGAEDKSLKVNTSTSKRLVNGNNMSSISIDASRMQSPIITPSTSGMVNDTSKGKAKKVGKKGNEKKKEKPESPATYTDLQQYWAPP